MGIQANYTLPDLENLFESQKNQPRLTAVFQACHTRQIFSVSIKQKKKKKKKIAKGSVVGGFKN